jgi:hypothetical protein
MRCTANGCTKKALYKLNHRITNDKRLSSLNLDQDGRTKVAMIKLKETAKKIRNNI